jgi:hypothetical protein
MSWAICHCVWSFFLFWLRRRVEVAICTDLEVLFLVVYHNEWLCCECQKGA